ncbi:hypothetical protein RBA41_03075 [Massilia sp. CCM 9210]|uniref:hypothetical protein n=1 Tax=Massilia scottii TaxID=3057166 RepID=UPI0027964337|nr:hypothetical protein [Massilia sp. CCM 9210]MDQ1812276.1 hypothetical protein [Massilia sp. CCM 9210]
MILKTLPALCLALFVCAPALAQNAATPDATATAFDGSEKRSQVWLTSGFATYHFQSDKDLNGRNPGVGVEYRLSEHSALTAGRFFNSDRQHSKYVGMYYQPLSYAGVRLGAVLGGFDGYPKMRDGGWFLAAIPTATFEYKRVGVNVAVVPTYKDRLHGGISVQLKLKLFE